MSRFFAVATLFGAMTLMPSQSSAHDLPGHHSHHHGHDEVAVSIAYHRHGGHHHGYHGHGGHGYGHHGNRGHHQHGGHGAHGHGGHGAHGHGKHGYGHPGYRHDRHAAGHGHHPSKHTPRYYCPHCRYHTTDRSAFYGHVHHHHHVPWYRIAANISWHPVHLAFVFGGH